MTAPARRLPAEHITAETETSWGCRSCPEHGEGPKSGQEARDHTAKTRHATERMYLTTFTAK